MCKNTWRNPRLEYTIALAGVGRLLEWLDVFDRSKAAKEQVSEGACTYWGLPRAQLRRSDFMA